MTKTKNGPRWTNEKVLAQLFMLRMRAANDGKPEYAALLTTIIDRIEGV